MKQKLSLLLLLIFAALTTTFAQDDKDATFRSSLKKEKDEPRSFKDRLWYGGGINLGFGGGKVVKNTDFTAGAAVAVVPAEADTLVETLVFFSKRRVAKIGNVVPLIYRFALNKQAAKNSDTQEKSDFRIDKIQGPGVGVFDRREI